jgi:hypothetical protein
MSADSAARVADSSDSCPYLHVILPEKQFPSCLAYWNWQNSRKRRAAEAHWKLEAVPDDLSQSGPGTYTYQLKLSDESYLTEPNPTWPNMTTEERDALPVTLHNLTVHEHGHLEIATQYVETHRTGSVRARTSAQADRLMEQRKQEHMAKLQRKENKYDAVTHHGETQTKGPEHGFPGGDNAVLTCSLKPARRTHRKPARGTHRR